MQREKIFNLSVLNIGQKPIKTLKDITSYLKVHYAKIILM